MVAPRAVAYDLDAIETVANVGVVRHPELFARLAGHSRIVAFHHRVPEDGLLLPNDALDPLWQLKLVHLSAAPRREPSAFAIVVAAGEEQLWSDEQYPLTEAKEAAVVQGIIEVDGHADVAEDVFRQRLVREYLLNGIPAMPHGVQLEKVILAAISADFELWPQAIRGSELLRLPDRLDQVPLVVLEAHRPLVELGYCNHCILLEHLKNVYVSFCLLLQLFYERN